MLGASEKKDDCADLVQVWPTAGGGAAALYLGSRKPSADFDVLSSRNIKFVLNCAPTHVPNSFPDSICYLSLDLQDKPHLKDGQVLFDDITAHFDTGIAFIGFKCIPCTTTRLHFSNRTRFESREFSTSSLRRGCQ